MSKLDLEQLPNYVSSDEEDNVAVGPKEPSSAQQTGRHLKQSTTSPLSQSVYSDDGKEQSLLDI